MDKNNWIIPNWSAPAHINAFSTTRLGGVSQAPFDGLNLGLHVEDNQQQVLQNRQYLRDALNLPNTPLWLEQIHSREVVDADSFTLPYPSVISADASVSHCRHTVCVVMTADCLPVLLTNKQGNVVGAAHAGWRGLNDGIIEATIAKMVCDPADIIAWLGPAIGKDAFEVGDDVRDAFLAHPTQTQAMKKQISQAFQPAVNTGKWFADIYALARLRLKQQGVQQVFGGDYCTYHDAQRFFSYRRDGKTGRMASLIFIA